MKYQARLPKHNDNVSHSQPLKAFFSLLTGLVLVFVMVYWLLGLAVDLAVDNLSEDLHGRLISLLAEPPAALQAQQTPREHRVQKIVDELRQCAQIDYPLQVVIQDSDLVNAFATGSGHIIILSGLLEQIKTENGLAFVLGHEIGHFQNRDHLRSMGRGVVLLAASALLSGADSGVSKILAPTVSLEEMRFSQDRELAADVTGLGLLNCRYGHVGGATEFFVSQLNSTPGPLANIAHYFASHPQAVARIQQIETLAAEQNYHSESPVPLVNP